MGKRNLLWRSMFAAIFAAFLLVPAIAAAQGFVEAIHCADSTKNKRAAGEGMGAAARSGGGHDF
jgi:hypothetical protein